MKLFQNTPGNEECKGNFEENTPIKQKGSLLVFSFSLFIKEDVNNTLLR